MEKTVEYKFGSAFDDMYYMDVLPVLRKYEKFRHALFYKTLLVELCCILGFVGYYLISRHLVKNNTFEFYTIYEPVIFYIVLIVAITAFIWTPIDNFQKFKSGLKTRCHKALKNTFNDLKWDKSEINDYLIRQSQLFGEYNRISYDDKFIGNYKNTPYSVAEANMLYIVEGKHKMVFPVFKGVIISFKANKNIKAHTLVTTKGDNSIKNYNPAYWYMGMIMFFLILYGYFTNCMLWMSVVCFCVFIVISADMLIKKRKFQGVKLEDLKFDERFSVFSKDQIEARYLITPSFMNRLNHLRTSFGTKKIKCAFFDDKILFAISTNKDLFELGDFHRSLINKKKIKDFYDEITAIYNMIDYFKLNEKTGL